MRKRHQYRMLQAAFVLTLVGVAFFGAHSGMSPIEQAGQQPAQPGSYGKEHPGTIWHWLTHDAAGFFTLILCAITGWLACVTRGLYLATTDLAAETREASAKALAASTTATNLARDSLIASQRAWLRVEVSLGGSPLRFEENGSANLNISFVIKNIGNAPAINIHPHAWLVPMKGSGGYHWQEQVRRSDEIRKAPVGGGFALFPHDVFPQSIGVSQWSLGIGATADEIKGGLAESQNIIIPVGKKKSVALSVIGFIDYTFPTDPERHHQTGFLFDIVKMTEPPWLVPEPGQIPVAELRLLEGTAGMGIGRFAD